MLPTHKYGIVIDSGSSGSRIQIYKWEDPSRTRNSASEIELASPPKIILEPGWSRKITPGISTFGDKTTRIWKDHYKKLIDGALKVIPPEQVAETPIYVLSTAGMRLLPNQQREAVLKETCKVLQKNTKFLISDCDEHVQVIDGGTEGIYGWLALNYLMGQFNNYKPGVEDHESIGFMDMGGASTQIAFVPSSAEEIKKHDEDLSKVVLRNINGESQMWRVFVETWLGFGANQARSRYLKNLIYLSAGTSPKSDKRTVYDPCMPKDAQIKGFEYEGRKYSIKGSGNYQSCLRDIYPLLMKHLKCIDEPCLFNGIHAPKMNFEKDKFVGVSEYWYTANDIFHSGGEYNFHSFNQKVKEFCESLWNDVLRNSKDGKYSQLPELFLYDACFKASWVINVLHEGFELPRLGLDIELQLETSEMKDAEKAHVPFKSADSVNGDELSWTLGKILLVASSQIESKDSLNVGITLSEISSKQFSDLDDSDDEYEVSFHYFYSLILFGLVIFILYRTGFKLLNRVINGFRKSGNVRFPPAVKLGLNWVKTHSPSFVRPHIARAVNYIELQQQTSTSRELELGHNTLSPSSQLESLADLSVLRTRSTINLTETDDASRPVEFLNKPFATPKKHNALFENSDVIPRVSSSSSVARGKPN